MERETIKIITPKDKHEVIIKAWISGLEKRKINSPYLARTNKNGEDQADVEEIYNSMLDAQIKYTVISINGSSDKIIEVWLKMKSEDYDFIINETNKIVEPKIDLKKK